MILYFTGTGNSRYLARLIADRNGDTLLCINDMLRMEGDGTGGSALASEMPFVFVLPVYAWRMPRVVKALLQRTEFRDNTDAYFVFTCGESSGNAEKEAKELCREKGLRYRGSTDVVMADNYLVMFTPPAAGEAKELLLQAENKAKAIAGVIRRGETLPGEAIGFSGRFYTALVNPLFYRLYVSAKAFRATDRCIGCGKCASLCPLSNIRMEGKRPVWGQNCTHCMACICACPESAVEYGNKTKGKRRGYLE